MARNKPFLSDEQWELIKPLLPEAGEKPNGGRPRRNDREVLEGIFWILRTGAPWADLPREYPSASTCWRRLARWQEEDLWVRIWTTFLQALDDDGKLDWYENFGDGTFASAKKGPWSGSNQKGQGHKAYGGGRRSGSSDRKLLLLCIHA